MKTKKKETIKGIGHSNALVRTSRRRAKVTFANVVYFINLIALVGILFVVLFIKKG